jgi:hypothetical protein
MDFSHADRANPQKLNIILWRDNKLIPSSLLTNAKEARKDDDD